MIDRHIALKYRINEATKQGTAIPNVILFEERMRKSLSKLEKATLVYHYKRALFNKIGLR